VAHPFRPICCVSIFVCLAGCASSAAPPSPIDRALSAAARYLYDRQNADGAWQSEVYGVFKEGDALTPLVLQALVRLPPSAARDAACRRGANYLAAMVRPDGDIDPGRYGLTYPVHTAAAAVIILSRPDEANHRARDAWLSYLRQQQLAESLGWKPVDIDYGGWSYAKSPPQKPAPGVPISPMIAANLSSTVCALNALRAAGCANDDPAIQKAMQFVERCQNFTPESTNADDRYDDGGFFFVQGDAGRNKAGVAGIDGRGRERYFSYGSTTSDGLRALVDCGLSRENPRVTAARRWLEEHFRADTHPGTYAKEREGNRDALYFYYCASAVQAFERCGAVRARWGVAFANELLRRQRSDGSWQNSAVDVREDDPLVATSLAIIALAGCRESQTPPPIP
jgi:squalene-hopene/tetraprenyl-beta-curcumene cyclase